MRIVARVAQRPLRMVLGVNLRKALRLGWIRLMAPNAQRGHVRLLRLVPVRIVGVLCEGAMAGLARYLCVLPLAALLSDVIVANRASGLARERDGPRPNLAERCAAIMAVLLEGGRHDEMPNHQEGRDPERKDNHGPDQVLRLFQYILHR